MKQMGSGSLTEISGFCESISTVTVNYVPRNGMPSRTPMNIVSVLPLRRSLCSRDRTMKLG